MKTSKSLAIASMIALGLFIRAQAQVPTTYYVSPNGLTANTGTSTNSPWPYLYAITNAGGSNTIVVMPGVYSNTAILSLAQESGLYIKSQVKWGARLTGIAGNHTFFVSSGVSNGVLDGFEVAYSYEDDIKFPGTTGWAVRNCWIHDAGHGDPAWVTNSTGSYTGQGIAAYACVNTLIENCLIETNGAYVGQDHGIYMSGTNNVIRNCVIRRNIGYGWQLYDGTGGRGSAENRFYNNLVYANEFASGNRLCLTIWCSDTNEYSFTNYVYNNTLQNAGDGSFPAVNAQNGGYVALTNNIILSPYPGSILGQVGATIRADYNVSTNTLNSSGTVLGSHNVVSTFPALAFVNSSAGLYWIGPNSAARNAAVSTCFGPVDFFGNPQHYVVDVGAFQFDGTLATDIRVLDPTPSYGADYWTEPVLKDITSLVGPVTVSKGFASLTNNAASLMSSNVGTGTWSFTNSDKVNWLCYIMGGTASGISQNDSAVEVAGSTNLNATLILQPNEWLRITNTTAPRFTFKRF